MQKIITFTATISLLIMPFSTNSVRLVQEDKLFNSYSPDNIENLIKTVDKINAERGYEIVNHPDAPIDNIVQKIYDKYINQTTGSLKLLYDEKICENIIQTFTDSFTNNLNSAQTFTTKSYSKTVTETTTLNYEASTQISAKMNVDFLLGSSKIEASINQSDAWSKTISENKAMEVPSQSFIVNPLSVAKVDQTIREMQYKNHGFVGYYLSKNDLIPGNIVWVNGEWWHVYVKVEDIIKELKNNGYEKNLLLSSSDYSIIKTDNVDNPKIIYLTVPFSWISNEFHLDVSFEN